jgi:hypothetical protein
MHALDDSVLKRIVSTLLVVPHYAVLTLLLLLSVYALLLLTTIA